MHSKKTGGEREEEQIKRRHPPTHIHKANQTRPNTGDQAEKTSRRQITSSTSHHMLDPEP